MQFSLQVLSLSPKTHPPMQCHHYYHHRHHHHHHHYPTTISHMYAAVSCQCSQLSHRGPDYFLKLTHAKCAVIKTASLHHAAFTQQTYQIASSSLWTAPRSAPPRLDGTAHQHLPRTHWTHYSPQPHTCHMIVNSTSLWDSTPMSTLRPHRYHGAIIRLLMISCYSFSSCIHFCFPPISLCK